MPVRFSPEVAEALRSGRPVVALETSVFAQGLPAPHNAGAARRMQWAIDRAGAVAGMTAVVNGEPTVGLTAEQLARFLGSATIRKASARDIPVAMAEGGDAATTVAGSLVICRAAGIPVFATGGIGGVHREPPFDESADLLELTRTPAVVVCSGAKSVLDVPATFERLETLGVTVVGFGTHEFPGFLYPGSGIALDTTVSRATDVARLFRMQRQLGVSGSLLVVQPVPAESALSRDDVESATQQALDEARRSGVRGGAITPFLLAAVERATDGRSLIANLSLLESNARLAAEIAVAVLNGD